MRQLSVHVPAGNGSKVLDIAREARATNVTTWRAEGFDGPVDVALLHVPNAAVETLLERLETLPQLHVTLNPRGIIPLQPPAEHAAQQAKEVELRSPIEIFLAGLQSVGSWKGFLGYALCAGLVVWVGLYTNTIYLLTASMLIAPFAGPAMNAAIATARGDWRLLLRALARYAAAVVVTVATCALMSLALRQEIATTLMTSVANLSSVAAVLPLAAGLGGAMHLIQSERSSLVSGAAVGMLVAASLAPPAGVLGMAIALGEWGLCRSSFFVLVLQLAGINLAGAAVFRWAGLTPQGPRYERGTRSVAWASLALTVVVLAALLIWQFADAPELQRSSVARRATAEAREVVEASGLAQVIEARLRFPREQLAGRPPLVCEVYVLKTAAVADEQVKQQLSREIRQRLMSQYEVTPLVDLTVLEGEPADADAAAAATAEATRPAGTNARTQP